jgi:hypothetical protein
LFTLEHAASYNWGKSFIFIDKLDDKDAGSTGGSSETYSEVTADISLSYLYGIGSSWNIPGFTFFNSNLYVRNNALKLNNFQWTTAWSYPFKVAEHQFYFDGFFDWESTPENGQNLFKIQPQIKYDLGALYDYPNRLTGYGFCSTAISAVAHLTAIAGNANRVLSAKKQP